MKINMHDIVKLTGKSHVTISKRIIELDYEQGGEGSKTSEKRYESKLALPLIYKPDFAPDDGGTGSLLNLQAERARLAHHQANKYILESENLKGRLIEADIVQSVWEGQLTNLRAKLLALPTKVAPRVTVMDEEADVVGYLRAVMYEALNELREFDASEYRRKGFKTGTLSSLPAADTVGKRVGGSVPQAKRRGKRRAGAVGHVEG